MSGADPVPNTTSVPKQTSSPSQPPAKKKGQKRPVRNSSSREPDRFLSHLYHTPTHTHTNAHVRTHVHTHMYTCICTSFHPRAPLPLLCSLHWMPARNHLRVCLLIIHLIECSCLILPLTKRVSKSPFLCPFSPPLLLSSLCFPIKFFLP